MSVYEELIYRLSQIQEQGGVIDRLELAQDIQQAILAEILGRVDTAPPDVLRDAHTLANGENAPYLGLTFLEGFKVVSRPSGFGVHIVYH